LCVVCEERREHRIQAVRWLAARVAQYVQFDLLPHARIALVHFALLTALLLQAAAPDTVALRGARSPAYGPDGRLAIAVEGDIFVRAASTSPWTRVTSGPAWDRDPAWTRDGSAIVFSSDRSGKFAIWRVRLDARSIAAEPERLTNSTDAEGSPTVAPD